MISSRPFGTLSNGSAVTCYRLTGSGGAYVDILDYGATVQSIVVPDRSGKLTDVALGYNNPGGYEKGTCFLGCTVGRHANRIGGGSFTLDGNSYQLEKNDGENNLHSGPNGYEKRFFQPEIQGDTLVMRLHSPHMDQGFPGALELAVAFSFSQDNALRIHYTAVSTEDTLVNITNHSYFDLSGGQAPMEQLLHIDADFYTENDAGTLPTGVIASVGGTPFDFRREKPIGQDIHADHIQLKNCGGYDHNFVLNTDGQLRPVATLRSPLTGIKMTVETDMPGIQFYSGNSLTDANGKNGGYSPRDGVALESQFFPNGMAFHHFPHPILRAGETWDHTTIYHFA
ncbi:MAG: galactose mutarotase [Oscillospiraceae bacterium]|nr:galactose mutarotase [Oscillospiraceae bacterium]